MYYITVLCVINENDRKEINVYLADKQFEDQT